jgi:hypothetical protein
MVVVEGGKPNGVVAGGNPKFRFRLCHKKGDKGWFDFQREWIGVDVSVTIYCALRFR